MVESGLSELARLIAQHAPHDGAHATEFTSLVLFRASSPTTPLHVVHEPGICILAQGRKRVAMGGEVREYAAGNFLAVSVDLPITGQVIEASSAKPYLGVKLVLSPTKLSEVMLELGLDTAVEETPQLGLTIGPTSAELLNAAARIVRLLDSPRELPFLAPLIERELLYRLLLGPHSAALRQVALPNSRYESTNRVIRWLKLNYALPFRVETLAKQARMSPSAFHRHFKAVTSMSPLQYQKQLRLQEARRLMLGESLDAAAAARRVGYESASQFSREYRRMFGLPPLQDIAQFKEPMVVDF